MQPLGKQTSYGPQLQSGPAVSPLLSAPEDVVSASLLEPSAIAPLEDASASGPAEVVVFSSFSSSSSGVPVVSSSAPVLEPEVLVAPVEVANEIPVVDAPEVPVPVSPVSSAAGSLGSKQPAVTVRAPIHTHPTMLRMRVAIDSPYSISR